MGGIAKRFPLNPSILRGPPSIPTTIHLLWNLEEILSAHARTHSHEEVTLKVIAAKLPLLHLSESGSASVIVSSNCESTLALHVLQLPNVPSPLEIRVSKKLCWLCKPFIEALVLIANARILYLRKSRENSCGLGAARGFVRGRSGYTWANRGGYMWTTRENHSPPAWWLVSE